MLDQLLIFSARHLGLGVVAVDGFFDQELNELLALPRDEEAAYLVCVGHGQG